MAAVVALDALLESRRIWRGQPAPRAPSTQPTGFDLLDEALPDGGWPETALTELLLPADGIGELRLLWPTLARLSRTDGMIALIAPPYLPFAQAWANAGVQLNRLQVIRTDPRNALWAAEQCLRSAACSTVLCWPHQANDRALRRLQVAAETGQCLGFAMRPMKAAANPSPAALRIAIDAAPTQLRVLKCRGGNPPTRPIPFPSVAASLSQSPTNPALPTRSPTTIGQEPAGGGIAQKPAMDGRRPASGQEALMKGRSNTPTGRLLRDQATRTSTNRQLHAQATRNPTDHPLRDQAKRTPTDHPLHDQNTRNPTNHPLHDQTTRIPTNHLLRAPTTPSAGNFLHDQPVRAPTTMLPAPATIPFRPRLLPTQAQ